VCAGDIDPSQLDGPSPEPLARFEGKRTIAARKALELGLALSLHPSGLWSVAGSCYDEPNFRARDQPPPVMKTELLEQCNVCAGTRLEVVDRDCNIMRCPACGYIFDNPRPTTEELVEFYSRPTQYDSWLGEIAARDRLWKRRLNKLRSTRKPGSLLDVGAGIGQFLAWARACYHEVYGTEVSRTAVQIAKEKYDLDLFHGTIEQLQDQGKLFDNVCLFHVLEHVPDPKSLLRICHSLLSENGILVIAVPNEVASFRALTRRGLLKFGLKKPPRRVGRFGLSMISLEPDSVEVHLSHFTPQVLRHLLTMTGFSIVKSTLDPHYVATGIQRMKADVYYTFCLAFHKLFQVNLFDTMLVIARKTSNEADVRAA
jgi:2-polyprenyl-3-methyl-5-hydroxy-6-metoxy-1,4-benzoquinol methylase